MTVPNTTGRLCLSQPPERERKAIVASCGWGRESASLATQKTECEGEPNRRFVQVTVLQPLTNRKTTDGGAS